MRVLDEVILPRTSVALWPGNPRTITAEEKEDVRNSLQKFGAAQRQTVWYSGKEWFVLGGNQRQVAMEELEAEGETVPAEIPYVHFKGTRDEAAMLNVALNRIGGAFDPNRLPDFISDLLTRNTAEALSITGFTPTEITAIADRNMEVAQAAIGEHRPLLLPDGANLDAVKAAMEKSGVDTVTAQLIAETYIESQKPGQGAPPSLHDLESRYGPPPEQAFWPTWKIKVTEATFERFKKVFAKCSGALDSDRFAELVRLAA